MKCEKNDSKISLRNFFLYKKKNNSGLFKLKKKSKFLSKRNIIQFGKYFSPRTQHCLNNIEIIVFITLKIIPRTCLFLFYFLLVSSSILRNYKSLNFFDLSFFFAFISFFKISKTPTKTSAILPFFLSFFLVLKSACCYNWWLDTWSAFFSFLFRRSKLQITLFFFLSFSLYQVGLLLQLLTCHLVCFLFFSLTMWQATTHMIHSFSLFLFPFLKSACNCDCWLDTWSAFFSFLFRRRKLQITWFVLSFFLSFFLFCFNFFSFFKDYNKNIKDPNFRSFFLSFFLSFLNTTCTDAQMYKKYLCFILLGDLYTKYRDVYTKYTLMKSAIE